MATKKTADAATEILGLIASGTYEGALIDVRQQAERLASMPKIRERVIADSAEIEGKRQEIREKAHADCKDPNFAGLAMPRVPLAVGKLANDPQHGPAYIALASAVGDETPFIHFLKREKSDVVIGVGWRVMAGEVDGVASPVVVAYDNSVIEGGEFIGSKVGNGAMAYVKFGPVVLQLPIAQSDKMKEEREQKGFDKTKWDFDLTVGSPTLSIQSAHLPDTTIPSMAPAPMAYIHPKDGALIPWGVPLKIEKILTTTTRYEGQRIVVTDPGGTPYIGLLAVDGIRRVCGERQKTEAGGTANTLTEASIGKRFQIDGAMPRVNKDGEPLNVLGETAKKAKKGEFVQCYDVFISDPDDTFEIDL